VIARRRKNLSAQSNARIVIVFGKRSFMEEPDLLFAGRECGGVS
jgi:hypothetical protein